MTVKYRHEYKDQQFSVRISDGGVLSSDHAQLSVLMDIRDELQKLNRLLHCPNFVAIPRTLRRISANTAKPRKKRAAK